MARSKIGIYSRGVESVAKSTEVRRGLDALAEAVAVNVRSLMIRVEGKPGDVSLPVEIGSQTTDRARATVTIAHPSGLAVQSKHGALTRAAAQAGLEVKTRQ